VRIGQDLFLQIHAKILRNSVLMIFLKVLDDANMALLQSTSNPLADSEDH
jgi:hypothetical protein